MIEILIPTWAIPIYGVGAIVTFCIAVWESQDFDTSTVVYALVWPLIVIAAPLSGLAWLTLRVKSKWKKRNQR